MLICYAQSNKILLSTNHFGRTGWRGRWRRWRIRSRGPVGQFGPTYWRSQWGKSIQILFMFQWRESVLCYVHTNIFLSTNTLDEQGGDEDGGGGSDIGALLGALGPLSGSLSGVSFLSGDVLRIISLKIRVTYGGKYMSAFMRSLRYLKFHKQETIKRYTSRCTLLIPNYVKYRKPLKTKRRPLYLKPHSVPRCKHFSSRL
jgi:hypothetical protein